MPESHLSLPLPKKQLATGVILLNAHGHLLLVKPTYRPDWLLPGGVVEENESPYQAAIREVQEELGLTIPVSQLLCIEYQINQAKQSDNLQFVFFGGMLNAQQIQAITLPPNEISEYRFITITDGLQLLTPRGANRVQHALNAIKNKQTVYLENGVAILT